MSGSCGFYNEFSLEISGSSRYRDALARGAASDTSGLDHLVKVAGVTQTVLAGVGPDSISIENDAAREAVLMAYLEKLVSDNFGSAWGKAHAEGVLNFAHRVKYIGIPIPGLDAPHEDCGRVFSVGVCPDCSYKHPIKNHCDRPGCAVCYEHWATKEAKKVGERVAGFRTAYKEVKGRRLGNPMHIIEEKRGDDIVELVQTTDGIKKYLRMCADEAKRAGILSSVQIFHLYKIHEGIKKKLFCLLEPDGKGLWDLVMNDALGLGTLERYVYVAPHVHLVGFGFMPKGKDVYKRSGWFISNKGRLSKEKDIYQMVRYALLHCAVIPGMKTVRSYGGLSNNSLGKVVKSKEWVNVKCPLCGADLDKYFVLTGLCESYIRKETVYVYKLKLRPPKGKRGEKKKI